MKTKIVIGGWLALTALSHQAQNASYRLNHGSVSGVNNSAYGWNSINNTTTGADNSACGFRALNANTIGNRNSGIGSRALLFNTSGDDNSATGHNALFSNTTGSYNTANGSGSLLLNTTGTYNTAIGYQADVGASGLINATAIGANAVVNTSYAIQLGDGNVTQIFGGVNTNATFISGGLQITGGSPASGKVLTSDPAGVATWQAITASGVGAWSTTGNAGTTASNFIGTTDSAPIRFGMNNFTAGLIDFPSNTFFLGYKAGISNFQVHNMAVGNWALYSNVFGQRNTAIGPYTLYSSTGNRNTALGNSSGYNTSSGDDNSAIGAFALNANTTGFNNTALGSYADVSSGNLNNATAIGANALVNTSNAIQLGDGGVTQVFAGTGNNATVIAGGLKITGGAPAVGKVLTSDAVGNATWQTPSGGGSGWSLTGDAGTVDGTNFIGTTDNVPLNFKVNNQKAGRIDGNLANTFFGYQAGNNGYGTSNTAFGAEALFLNGAGNQNVAVGYRAMRTNSSGMRNIAMGSWALINNVTGNNNIAIGSTALPNTNSSNNTGVGDDVMYHNNLGFDNVAVGREALYFNTNGDGNTSIGNGALYWSGTGNNNTGLGYWSNLTAGNLNNATAVGANALVNASDKVVVGSTGVTVIGGYAIAGWSTLSDARFKENVKDDAAGLDFILKLRPVTYNYNMKKLDEHLMQNMPDSIKEARMQSPEEYAKASQLISTGFIAQEVEKTVNELGVHFDGVNAPKNNTDNYSIGYAKFVVPLVKAVQEQQAIIEEQKQVNQNQQQQIDELKAMVSSLAGNTGSESKIGSNKNIAVELSDKNAIVLNQNVPNPFAETTVINYNVPTDFGKAQILFSTADGKVIKVVEITEKGAGSLNVFANDLTHGLYSYTLVVDGKIIDTKKMIKE